MLEEYAIPKDSLSRNGLQEMDTNACIAADILDDLAVNDPLYITEDDNYDRCEALAREFLRLTPRQKNAAIDVLSANLSSISTSAKGLLSHPESASSTATMRHRNGIQMVVFLLHSIAIQAVKDPQSTTGAENTTKAKATGRGRKAAADPDFSDGTWDWEQSKQRVLTAIRDLFLLVDLRTLFKGLTAAQQLINLCLELALQGLQAPNVIKQESNWPACRDVLVRGAVQYQQIDFVAQQLMELVRKHEHMPQLAALAAKYAEEHHNNTQLGVMLLARFTEKSPEDYDAQYAANQGPVRLAGEFVASLAELMPKVVSNHVSQLQAYLACNKAYSLRGALLQATGSILVQVYRTDNLNSSLGAGAVQAHLRSKEALLALLHARILDKVSFVRQKVLQTWAKLVEESCVPLSHWNTLLQEAIGRLEDDSQLVVKAALQLLHKMVAQGIFQPPLKTQVYINTLQQTEAELAKLRPAKAARNTEDDAEEEVESEGAEDDADAKSAKWEEGGIQIKEEPVETPDNQPASTTNGLSNEDSSKPRNDAAIERLRAMVASLKEGASFCKRLTATLPQLQILLANPAANLVHDAIIFLTLCKTYEVTGANEALRGMWPLVFSKHEPVRAAVLDSWHILHLHDKLPKQQMEELVHNVIPNCSLSQLTALESIIAALVQQGKLSAVNLMKQAVMFVGSATMQLRTAKSELSKFKNTGGDDSSQATQDQLTGLLEEFSKERRSTFTLISMLTAAQPTALVAAYVPVLLDLGLAVDPLFTSLQDPWVTRHTCLALRYAAAALIGTDAAAATGGPSAIASNSSSSTQITPELHQSVLAALVKLLVATPAAAMSANWPTAAEAAVSALYALAPQPQELMAAVLDELFRRCVPGGRTEEESLVYGFSAAALSRFFLVLGRTGLQHLLCIEQTSKAIRASRLAADRAAAEALERQLAAAAAAGGSGGSRKGKAAATAPQPANEDIGAQLGVGSVAADAELDALADKIESQLLAKDQLLGKYGQLLSKFLHLKSSLSAPQDLQESALLALTQLMAIDASFCADNLRLLFTLLLQRHVSASVRVNMVVALADLASRFPNLLEPWTAEMYLTLADPEPAVRLSALSSLTHLVLGGMVKAKGRNVAHVAVLLVDDVEDIINRASLFFQSLAKTGSGNTRSASAAAGASAANPVYNLLPDCLSTLLTMKELREEQLQYIMQSLLTYVKDKQAESLRERLVARLQVGGPREWRLVAWCIGQLGYTEKGFRRIIELTACYRHALGEQQVFDTFMGLADKARRNLGGSKAAAASEDASSSVPGGASDLHTAVADWVTDLNNSRQAALQAAEVEAQEAARREKQVQEQQQGGIDQTETDAMETDKQSAEQQNPGDGMQETSIDDASDAPAGAAAEQTAAVDGDQGPEESPQADDSDQEQIELLLQSQAVDDEEPEQLSSEATAMRQQMARLSMAPTPQTVARRSHRPSSAATATTNRRAAIKSMVQPTGKRSAAGATQQSRRQGGRRPKEDSSESSSDDEGSDAATSDCGSQVASDDVDESTAVSQPGEIRSSRRSNSAAAAKGRAGRSTTKVPEASDGAHDDDAESDIGAQGGGGYTDSEDDD